MKKTIITLGGMPGSGKSSTARRVAEILGYTRFSSGDFAREVAARHNISIEEWNKKAESMPELDFEVDQAVRDAGEKSELVIDSRTAFHWIPSSFKVFLTLDPHIAAERTYKHIQEGGRSTQSATSVDDVYAKTVSRIESECARYKKLYSLDYLDTTQYDLVLDTAIDSIEAVSQKVVAHYREWLEK